MIYFPQLQTGAAAQFPLTRTVGLRTARCEFPDGSVMRFADPGARSLRWKLEYRGLTDQEWTALENCFRHARGRFGSFCFLDPFENLLAWSADLSKAAWTVAPGLQITAGAADAFGGTTGFLVTNTAATTQRLSQRLDIPASYQYCWSLYIYDAAPCKLMAESGDGGTWLDVPAQSEWQRVSMLASIPGESEQIAFGLDIPKETSVHICALQVDAQPSAAKPRSTRARSGVMPACRFDQDELILSSAGLNDHATTVHILSNLSV